MFSYRHDINIPSISTNNSDLHTSAIVYTVGVSGYFSSTTDLIFGLICEEMGIIIAFAVVLAFAFIAIYAVISSRSAPSTFYSIAACSASAMLLFQICLNIFGITDLLPLTGVTLPFISRGGSSIISCWMLLAFIKAVDRSTYRYGGVRQ